MAAAPVRTCVGCRARRPAEELVRVALADGAVVLGAVGNGRGAWCCPLDDCLDRALRKGALARALRTTGDRIDAESLRSAFRNRSHA